MSTALYRRYRPETFADVIGQEHVTDPLMAAIDKNRVNHAYLFSGPRGCGKTTSARILARCLNCAGGPTSTPCGVCDSCVELARNGSGSLDVIEIDAASHGGVDDARDLRERATFAPVRDRYKIFIIDEAHMVTSAGFNALLKIVEEPPEHILFIFATTEPDKVIGTIRSRTHHYPFRLVPPEPLMAYLELLCRQEHVSVAPGVLSLVVRAGGGSVRDSLSVLDQLMAGAGESGLDYELAVSLLGYTHATLLGDVVDAIAASDAGTVFSAVDRVIQTGHDPRRFVEDLLERFRDLIVINAVPEGAASILRGIPDDQLNRMRTQANQLGGGELSRSADVTNTALTEMTGATSPRLHLELLCARLLLPAADQSIRGTLARVDRIERRLEYANGSVPRHDAAGRSVNEAPPATAVDASALPVAESPVTSEDAVGSSTGITAPAPAEPASTAGQEPTSRDRATADTTIRQTPVWGSERSAPSASTAASDSPAGRAPDPVQVPAPDHPPAQAADAAPARSLNSVRGSGAESSGQIEMVRRAWPEIMDELAKIKRITWLNVNVAAKPRSLEGNVLALAFTTPGNAIAFQRGSHSDNLKQAVHKVLGLTCEIEALHDGAAAGEGDPKVPAARPAPTRDDERAAPVTTVEPESQTITVSAKIPSSPDPGAEIPSGPGTKPPERSTPGARGRTETIPSAPSGAGWSPRDTDDSWPKVEPPEDSYDPGPGWNGNATDPLSHPNEDQGSAPAPSSKWARPVAGPESSGPRVHSQTAHDVPAAQRQGSALQQRPDAPSTARLQETEASPPTASAATAPASEAKAATAPPKAPAAQTSTKNDSRTNESRTTAVIPDDRSKPVSRYKRLLDEAERKRAESAAASNSAVDFRYVEDVPSADDETVEESGLVGRIAIERILNGRLVEEQSVEPQ